MTDPTTTIRARARVASLPRVVVVAQGPPARGGIPSFAMTIVDDPILGERYDLELLNTTRKAERYAGKLTLEHARLAIVDVARVFRAGRRADVVHIQTALLPVGPLVRVVAVATAARLAGSRVLVHVHTGRVNRARTGDFRPSRLERLLFRLLAVAHEVLTVSNAGASTLSRLVPRVPTQRFDNAIDASQFTPLDPNVDVSSTDKNQEPVLVYVGTLSRDKGIHDLLVALACLQQRGITRWRLEVIGGANTASDEEAAELRGSIRDAGLADALLGPLDRADVAAHLARADVFVLPSHSEGQPISVLEAMASGLPVVGTRVGAMPDVVRDRVDGLLVEPHDVEGLADALARLVCDEKLRHNMGASARQRAVECHDLGTFRRHVEALYDSHLHAATP